MSEKAALVLVHGAWHGAWCFDAVMPELARLGHVAIARDLPGHGVNALFPPVYLERPADPDEFSRVFASQPSPLAGLTLDDYAASVIETIDAVGRLGFGRVVLVGHSLGGVTVTRVAEMLPDRVLKLVYLAAFMLPPGDAVVEHLHQDSGVASVLASDPALTGATRIDFRSADRFHLRRCTKAFFADCSEAQGEAVRELLTPDEPRSIYLAASDARPSSTAARAAIERHYIRCLQDRAIPIAAQDRMIAETDAALGASRTIVHSLDSSHSPFLSQPRRLAALLASIAGTPH
jgi:pimeloyl-ACP methyl ester carboxylesterase